MKRLVLSTMLGCLAVSMGACPFNPTTTTVQLVNDGNFPVEVTMYVGGSQYTTKELLRIAGEEIERTVPARQTVTITRDCEDLEAVFIDNAKVSIAGVGPEDESDLLRDGTDFGCGDTIRFTFTYTLLPPNLDIGVSYPG